MSTTQKQYIAARTVNMSHWTRPLHRKGLEEDLGAGSVGGNGRVLRPKAGAKGGRRVTKKTTTQLLHKANLYEISFYSNENSSPTKIYILDGK